MQIFRKLSGGFLCVLQNRSNRHFISNFWDKYLTAQFVLIAVCKVDPDIRDTDITGNFLVQIMKVNAISFGYK